VTYHGDIENRIKTLVNVLRLPDSNQLSDGITPADGEDPFHVLTEDDELLTRPASPEDKSVKLIIRAEVTPYHFTFDNLSCG
jgi:hypothetical protein